MMPLLILGAIVVAVIYYYLVKQYNYWTYRGVEQGKSMLIFGDSLGIILRRQSFADYVQHVYNKFPGTRYCGIYQLFVPLLVVKDPELLKKITVKNFDHFTDHISFMPDNVDTLWEKNLLALKGQMWREMRQFLSPSFKSSKMRTVFVLIAECAENFVQHFLKTDEDVITMEMKDTFTRFTNDVIATTAFGVKVDSLGEPNNEFYLMGKDATSITSFWKGIQFLGYYFFPTVFKKLFNVQFFSGKVRTFFRQLVYDTIKERKEKGIVRPDMIHLLMEAQKGIQKEEENIVDTGFAVAQEPAVVKEKVTKELTNEDITAQALFFFLAGFDTVASILTFLSYELAMNQEIQNRLREEVYATLDECGGKLTYEGLLKMKYMDMVISETMRKWPAAVVLDRVCTKPFVIEPVTPDEKPLYIEKGMMIWLPTFALHRDPDYFPDPDRFDPERFNDEYKKNIKPYTYMPFGWGPRNCIGSRFALLEVKTVCFYLLLHFKIVPVERTVIPLKISKGNLLLNSEGGLWLGLTRIKSKKTDA